MVRDEPTPVSTPLHNAHTRMYRNCCQRKLGLKPSTRCCLRPSGFFAVDMCQTISMREFRQMEKHTVTGFGMRRSYLRLNIAAPGTSNEHWMSKFCDRQRNILTSSAR